MCRFTAADVQYELECVQPALLELTQAKGVEIRTTVTPDIGEPIQKTIDTSTMGV